MITTNFTTLCFWHSTNCCYISSSDNWSILVFLEPLTTASDCVYTKPTQKVFLITWTNKEENPPICFGRCIILRKMNPTWFFVVMRLMFFFFFVFGCCWNAFQTAWWIGWKDWSGFSLSVCIYVFHSLLPPSSHTQLRGDYYYFSY